MYHPLLTKQIILATMDCESENKDNFELFWKTWNDVLADFQAGLTFVQLAFYLISEDVTGML